jgi:hypothetical protein
MKKRKLKMSNDKIIQIEILIGLINMKLARSVYYEYEEAIQELEKLRHKVYYEDFDYQTMLIELEKFKERPNRE